MLVSKVDMMMIGKFIGYKEVAFYTVAFFIGNVFEFLLEAIGSIAYSTFLKLGKEMILTRLEVYIQNHQLTN